ncbi:MAG TPA: GGDEF domain-containing protein [Acidimicrobiales bacterium]|nr:GGDEF domain-containing protein [Acidimicrobiales bacterium]
MRRVRWIGVVFTIVQFGLYRPPAGVTIPFNRIPVMSLAVAALVVLNLISYWAASRSPRDPLQWAYFGVAGDALIVMSIVWLFAFDGTSALWALLVVPVLEAAYVASIRGALWVWAMCAAAYLARELFVIDDFGHPFEPESVSYRMGIVLIVAVTSGLMSRDLRVQMRAHDEARDESESRAELLRVVASSGRLLSLGDHETVLAAIVDGALTIGFAGAEICLFDESAGTWRSVFARQLPSGYPAQPIRNGLAGAVWARQERVVVDDYSSWESSVPSLRAEGFRSAVGCPIWSGGEVVAALIAGNREPSALDPHALEALDLFSAQAGAALASVRFLEQMRHQALHDALTGLPNLTLFEDRLTQAVAMARRDTEVLAVGVLDVDNFKRINDSLGHAAGNELLKQIALRLRDLMRDADTVARMGGDEFTMLWPGLKDRRDVIEVAHRVLGAFARPFVLGEDRLFLTPSLGMAIYPTDGLAATALLRSADTAMYRVKKRGRNGFELHEGGTEAGNKTRLSMESDLHRALDHGELRVFYQPVLHMASRQIVGVEALVRWEHAERGTLPPDEFIGVAEETGLIVAIDSWVLQTACTHAKAWSDNGLPGLRVSVNVSAQQLSSARLRAVVSDALSSTGLDPSLLELEVTERVAADELSGCIEVLDELRATGVNIAIDDFGTGYSALDRLHALSVDRLKIDKSFIAQIDSQAGSPIVAAAIAMAHSLNLEVVAEGVETEAQYSFLLDHGCDYAQGFLFSEPVSARAFPKLLTPPPMMRPVAV